VEGLDTADAESIAAQPTFGSPSQSSGRPSPDKGRSAPGCHKAALDMAAKGCGAAAFDRPHGAPPRRRQRRANASASHEKARVHGRSIFGQGFERIKAVIVASASTPANASLPGSWCPHSTRSSTNAWRSDSQCVRRAGAHLLLQARTHVSQRRSRPAYPLSLPAFRPEPNEPRAPAL
jgi:hypothetical protein